MVSIRCLRSVGLFSRTNETPACAAISRKRMGGGLAGAAVSSAATANPIHLRLFARWPNPSLTRRIILLFLVPFNDLLILCHRGARLFGLSGGAVCRG